MNDRLWRRAMVKSGKEETTTGSGRLFSWIDVDEDESFIQMYIKICRIYEQWFGYCRRLAF